MRFEIEIDEVESGRSNTREAPPPLIVRALLPGPLIVRLLLIKSSPEVSVRVPVRPG